MSRVVQPPRAPEMERKLSDYRLHYKNKDFPLLSFMYALLAGGEHALYCDYYKEFQDAYFEGSLDKQYVKDFYALMLEYYSDSKGQTLVVQSTPDDIDRVLDMLRIELNANFGPEPKW